MKSPWKSFQPLEPGAEYLVLASSIPPAHLRSTWRMYTGSRAVRKQLSTTDGVMGFALLARPLAKYYATLSVWRDEAALDAFVAAHPHDELMTSLAPEMGPTKFVRWTVDGADGRPAWNDALQRLNDSTASPR